MNDAEFIELLNLYVDQEISPADAARLEAEVVGNPKRRGIYQDYCRMQKACKMLATDFQVSSAPADEKVVAIQSGMQRRSPVIAFASLAGLAAAACLALVFVNRNQPAGSPNAPMAQVNTAQPQSSPDSRAGTTSSGIVHVVSVPVAQSTPVGNPLLLSGRTQTDAMMAAALEQTNNQFEWMRTVQLAPLQQRNSLETLKFETPAPLLDGNRVYSSPQSEQGPAEWVGFKFNK